jgi:hypothetical protein
MMALPAGSLKAPAAMLESNLKAQAVLNRAVTAYGGRDRAIARIKTEFRGKPIKYVIPTDASAKRVKEVAGTAPWPDRMSPPVGRRRVMG